MTKKTYDYVIAGAGILGLWAARNLILKSRSVCLIEKRFPGSGASGGFLGALMPHMPDKWNPKKQMQLDGLTSLPHHVSQLEADTGTSCDYRKCGRVIPIFHEDTLPQLELRREGARNCWPQTARLKKISTADPSLGWNALCEGIARQPVAYQFDDLSARIDPRKTVTALEKFALAHGVIKSGVAVAAIDAEGSAFVLENGERICGNRLIVANGFEAYPLLETYFRPLKLSGPIGRGVKGQAVLLELEHGDELPIIYHDGTYVVPHSGGKVAVGSTSRNDWQSGRSPEPAQFDPEDLAFLESARELVPDIRDAPIIGRWAGVRPRNLLPDRGTEPWFGTVPGHDNLIALIGGFKITFGLAHNAIELALGDDI